MSWLGQVAAVHQSPHCHSFSVAHHLHDHALRGMADGMRWSEGIAAPTLWCTSQMALMWFCSTLGLLRAVMGVLSAYDRTEYLYT